MTKKICFFIQTPLTARDYDRFGVELFSFRGFDVDFLDLTNILNPGYSKKYIMPDPIDYKKIIPANSWRDVFNYLKENSNIVAIDLMGGAFKTIPLYIFLKICGIRYASFLTNAIPAGIPSYRNKEIRFSEKLKRIVRRLGNPAVIGDIKYFIKRAAMMLCCFAMRKPEIILEGGLSRSVKFPGPSRGAHIISIHTLDYDAYLKHESSEKGQASKNNFIVFLDEYGPFHPDFLILENPSFSLEPDSYYRGLNKLFSYLEKKTGLPVKIAAHPSSRYELHPDYFNGREIVRGRTVDMVFDSKVVLAHSSTSLNFAILYKKPVIFVTSDEIDKTNYITLISSFATQFGKKPVNVDRNFDFDFEKEMIIDEEKYSIYREKYIKKAGTPNRLFWDIVADSLERFEYV